MCFPLSTPFDRDHVEITKARDALHGGHKIPWKSPMPANWSRKACQCYWRVTWWLNLPSKIMGVASLSTHLCEDKLSYLSCALTIYHYIEIMGRFCRSKLVKQWMQRTEDLLAWPSHFRKYKDDVWKSKDKNILMHFAENWIHADYTSS